MPKKHRFGKEMDDYKEDDDYEIPKLKPTVRVDTGNKTVDSKYEANPQLTAGDVKSLSKLALGSRFLRDGLHTKRGRLMQELYDAQINDMGGYENTSTLERELLRRSAAISTLANEVEHQFATGGQGIEDLESMLEVYMGLTRSLGALAGKVGLKRRARLVDGPATLEEYMDNK